MRWSSARPRAASDGCAPAASSSTAIPVPRVANAIGLAMRASLLCSLALACATTAARDAIEYEIAYDDNRPAEATAAVSSTWEVMVRFKPSGSSWKPLRLRALLAQEGQARWTVYAQDRLEQPGEVLASWDREYGKDAAS